MKNLFSIILSIIIIQSCALSPGMYDPPNFNKDLQNERVIKITPKLIESQSYESESYKISNGDELAIYSLILVIAHTLKD